MSLILTKISDPYNFLFDDLADPRVKSYFLMSSPFPTLGILFIYVYFVFKLGPRLMQNRPAYNLNRTLIVYNAFQIGCCTYMCYLCLTLCLFKYNILCEPVDYSGDKEALKITRLTWCYFMLKLLDLLDTAFFVLRKKFNQVTFLHVYHHIGMCFLGWIGTKYVAGGHGIYLGFINSIVHMVMYFYYFLTTWDKEYQKNIWWKKHITQLQITQFLLLMIHFVHILFQPSCQYPKWTSWVFLPQNIIMLVLFTKFYIKTYVKSDTEKKTDETAKLNNGNVKLE